MNRALWLLLALQLRGWLRYLGRSMRTLRGAVLVLVGLGVFLPWMVAVLLHPFGVPHGSAPPPRRRSSQATRSTSC